MDLPARNIPGFGWRCPWHAMVDAIAVYLVQKIDMLVLEGIIGLFAIVSLGIVFWLKPKFAGLITDERQGQVEGTAATIGGDEAKTKIEQTF